MKLNLVAARLWMIVAVSISAAMLPASPAHAVVILSNFAGTVTLGGSGYEGHSFTIPAGNAFNNLTFSWVSSNQTTPLAAGNLFLLTQEYLSTPANLSAATPGYIAESIGIASSAYVFNPTVTLNPSTQYWVYMGDDSSLAGGGYTFADPFAGGKAYEQFTTPNGNYFNNGSSLDFNFILSGEVVPEPAAWLMAAVGVLSLVWRRRKS